MTSLSDPNASTIMNLQSRLQEMEVELDSIKSSRNYYKDQCESLLLSLSNTMQKQTPAYRTSEEVEEMIEAIQQQQTEKRRKLKEKLSEDKKSMEMAIKEMQKAIAEKDQMLQQQDDARISLIEKLMESNLSPVLSLDSLSRLSGVSKAGLGRYFHRIHQNSPMAHYRRIRLRAALRMLRDGYSISEVAFLTGFSSSQHFASAFRHEFGLAPSKI